MQQPVEDSGGDAGARGCLLKDSLPGEVLNATRAVHKGDSLFQPPVASQLLDRFSRLARAPDTGEIISPREVVETSSISMAETMAASSSFTEGATLSPLPNPSSPSCIKLTPAIRVMRRNTSPKSDMLVNTMLGTPRLATLPTEPDKKQTS